MNTLAKKLPLTIALVSLCASAAHSQAADGTRGKTTGTISGSVSSTSGDLPSNTVVYISTVGAAVPPQTTVINPDGTFKIDNLEIGVYRVWAAAPGYVPDSQPATPDARGIYHTGDSANIRLRKGGVISGKVINSNNAPVVGAPVRAFRIRDERGKPIESSGGVSERMTDDRGIYRMYGLLPGTYLVSAGGMARFFSGYSTAAYDQDVPTYAPSSARDTAAEVAIRSGEEATADIQYRGEPGHAISGTVVGILQVQGGMAYGGTVSLTDVKNRTILVGASTSPVNNHTFAFYGLPDGEYELVAQQFSQSRDIRASAPKRVKIQGADVAGVNLAVSPLPAITGRVILDSSSPAECVRRRTTAFQETVVTIRRQKQTARTTDSDDRDMTEQVPLMSVEQAAEAVPDEKGDFILRNLRSGTYRLIVQLPSAAWYLRSVTLGPNLKSPDSKIISDGIGLKSQSMSGLSVTISEGAAAIRGRLTAAEGQSLPTRAFAYLVPAEKENATNLLRFFEARAGSDGTFAFENVPPGEYSILALNTEAERPPGILIRQDSSLRLAVTREAAKSKQSVTLKACERLENYELPLSLTTKP